MFTAKTPWIVLLFLWMGGSTWWHVCKIKQLCGDAPQPSSTTAADPMPALSIVDGEKLNLTVPGNFRYAKSGVLADAGAVGNTLPTLADYLKANAGRVLAVTGHYQTDEQNPSTYPNLGLARAEDIKSQLVKLGVNAEQITTKGLLVEETSGGRMTYNAKGDSLYGGLTFAFTDAATPVAAETAEVAPVLKTEQALAEAQKFTSVLKPIDLYFRLGKSDYIQTEDTRKFFAEAATYLKANKDKKLVLTGYTDDMGPDAVNMQLSRARAERVKRGLRRVGIVGAQIDVGAKGESEPKESNKTLEGRKANRRVTAVVQ